MPRGPPKGPAPLLLTGKEVDALYDCMELLHGALQRLAIPYSLIAGSLLGAVRSHSILFCDDDVSGREAAGGSSGRRCRGGVLSPSAHGLGPEWVQHSNVNGKVVAECCALHGEAKAWIVTSNVMQG